MKKISIIAAGILFIAGCDKKVQLVDPRSQILSQYWKTEAQAFGGSTAIYNGLITDGTYMRSFPGLTDSRGDDFTGKSPWQDLDLTGQFIIPSTSAPVQWIWRDHYIIVDRANQVLENVGAMDASILSADKKTRILGQAYFLRGLAYFNLANTFKAVPVITNHAKDKKDFYPPTATETVLWNQIISDLQTAETDLPVSYDAVTGPDQGEKGRATKGAAAGLLGKVYLYRKEYTNAAAQFEKFISGPLQNVYSLMPDYRDNFKAVNENNKESLFEVQFQEGGGTVDNWAGEPSSAWKQNSAVAITYAMAGKGFDDYVPTRWIYNEFKLEPTISGKSDPRLLATIASYEPADGSILAYGGPWTNPLTGIYPRKYTNDGLGKSFESILADGINYRVLRYSDILLMYAEVLNELNRTAEAYPFIQQVRARALLPDLATVKPGMTQAQMRDQLGHERALEFSIESQRINDIIRWGWLYDPIKLAQLKAHDPDFNTWIPGHEYLPVPQSELDVNKNLSTNPAN